MERLSRVACYFRWMRSTAPRDPTTSDETSESSAIKEERKTTDVPEYRDVGCSSEPSRRFCDMLESILLWENSMNSISVVIVFNILFWGIVVLEVRGFAAASSAALVIVLCYSTLEAQAQKENKPLDPVVSSAKSEQIEKIGKRVKSALHSLKHLRKEQPGVFCTAVCSLSLGLWIIGRTVNCVLLTYTLCMSILLGPALLLKQPGRMVHKEWDSEIEEFLPAVTEDNLQVLTRAGESGDQSPTPTSVLSDAQNEFFNDEDLMGLKMPSHEEGSTDDIDVSELELSAEEVDVDGNKFRSGHFEKGSSSEEEAELEPISRKLVNHSDESGSEFEIIDSNEIDNLDVA